MLELQDQLRAAFAQAAEGPTPRRSVDGVRRRVEARRRRVATASLAVVAVVVGGVAAGSFQGGQGATSDVRVGGSTPAVTATPAPFSTWPSGDPAARPHDPSSPPHPPEVKREEVTSPVESTTSAVFHNGQVYKVRTKTRTFVVTYADGSQGSLIEGGETEAFTPDGTPVQLPPGDPAFAEVHPTPEQMAQMDRIANGRE